ncbi:UNVERIFIED_CONTAM: Glutathione S-transferase 8 [Siphonaria sp. JEL0065]|nr:Glutathione S-transferase 8 [Siphonaria sp. JEL0065]
MHSGFTNIRTNMLCNIRARFPSREWSNSVASEIKKVCWLWENTRAETLTRVGNDDGWLFGEFTAVDAMYFPVVTRFLTYGVEIDGTEFPLAIKYTHRVLKDDAVKEMYKTAFQEEWTNPESDNLYTGMRIEWLDM